VSAAPAPVRPARARSALELRAASSLAWLRRTFVQPETPLVAVEVHATSVGIVRARKERRGLSLAAATRVDLAADVLQLSMTQPNLLDPERFALALRGALERAGILGGARVALVLPDLLARVNVLSATEVVARKRAELDEVVRFKLRKSVPFEIREARLAYTSTGSRAEDRMVVAAAFAPVVAAYEDACVSVGLEPGVVELAGLVLARAAFAGTQGDRLLVNWDEGYLTVLVLRDGWPLLVRTLPGEVAGTLASVVREVHNTVTYHRERLGGAALLEAALRSAVVPADEMRAALEPVLAVPTRVVDPWAALGGASMPDVAQSLAAAAACVGGRA
jgi:hypothetical protein